MMVAKRVSQVEIKQKALELILPHHPDFRASHAWISRFLRRHNINLKGKYLGNDIFIVYAQIFEGCKFHQFYFHGSLVITPCTSSVLLLFYKISRI